MAENPYDLAHELARAIRETEEYRAYLESRKEIEDDGDSRRMIEDLREQQMNLQFKEMRGEELDESDRKSLNRLQQIVESNPRVKRFIVGEQRMAVLYSDLMRILNDALDLDFASGKEGD